MCIRDRLGIIPKRKPAKIIDFTRYIDTCLLYTSGKSALMIYDKHANLKYKYGNRHFWAEGYYVSTVGLN